LGTAEGFSDLSEGGDHKTGQQLQGVVWKNQNLKQGFRKVERQKDLCLKKMPHEKTKGKNCLTESNEECSS